MVVDAASKRPMTTMVDLVGVGGSAVVVAVVVGHNIVRRTTGLSVAYYLT
jgi:hypothetical protein